jgi:hypothetical protein
LPIIIRSENRIDKGQKQFFFDGRKVNMIDSKLIMKFRNQAGSWRIVVVFYEYGESYFVNHFPTSGEINSYKFNAFKSAYEFVRSQNVERVFGDV